MNIPRIAKAMEHIDDGLITNALLTTKKKAGLVWIKWGVMAASLCLIIVGTVFWINSPGSPDNLPEGGGGDAGGAVDGVWPEGVDPVVASVAVIPAGESLLDVADATLVSINEEDAKNIERLGAYLPDTLPEGCRYGTAGYYETTMKDGTRYHMIRVTYESGQGTVPAPVPEGVQAASEMTGNTAFLWMVWGHRPDTDKPIYQPDEVTPQLLDQIGGVFYIDYDGVYVGIVQYEISTEELMSIINSIE